MRGVYKNFLLAQQVFLVKRDKSFYFGKSWPYQAASVFLGGGIGGFDLPVSGDLPVKMKSIETFKKNAILFHVSILGSVFPVSYKPYRCCDMPKRRAKAVCDCPDITRAACKRTAHSGGRPESALPLVTMTMCLI